MITLGMALFATLRLIEIQRVVQDAAQTRALAVSRTFAMMGAAAVLDNLFRIQEAWFATPRTPTSSALCSLIPTI